MPNPILGTLTQEVTEATTVMASATILILGFQSKIDAAVEAAIANGATEAELQPFAALSAELDTQANALAAAVVANT
jgi:hypothetical protein